MSKYCPACGEELVDEARFCKNCGKNLENIQFSSEDTSTRQFTPYASEKSHTAAIVIGYILSILIPLFGAIVAVYLMTRKDSSKAKKHGKYMFVVAVVVWFLSFLLLGF